jgi:hypothetical protein
MIADHLNPGTSQRYQAGPGDYGLNLVGGRTIVILPLHRLVYRTPDEKGF